jgi:hypothetical protein
MSRSRITWLFITALITGIVGGVLVNVGWLANTDEVFVRNGTDIVSVRNTSTAAGLFVLGAIGALAILIAAITGIPAWIGALLNTAGFERKRWFVGIALLGVINCGLLGVLAYLIGRPDGTRPAPVAPSAAPFGAQGAS